MWSIVVNQSFIGVNTHADAIIFHVAICAGVSQISSDGRRKFDICVAPLRKTLQNGDFKMEYLKLCDSDYRFMLIVWEHAPINSGQLVKMCNQILGWKKSTTYTTIRKMIDKGYISNENAIVSVLIEKDRVQADESEYFVKRTFDGSLPQFLTAFLGGKKISDEEAEQIKALIDEHRR